MKKIPTLFQRNYDGDRLVRNEVTPGCEWVLAGEGKATRKVDGTCCLVRDGKLYKRHEVQPGKVPPWAFEPANFVEEVTGKQQGWLPVGAGPEDKWHREGWETILPMFYDKVPDGTYELLGPKIQGNPEHAAVHYLEPHGDQPLFDAPRDFDGLKDYLRTTDIEGIVWHRENGDMVKLKKRDFGFKRK